ncbi:MAG: PHB depolymerase family esterase [Bacteroidales bacterium]|nr:PHB depolymerase family esterase [Bacteroidales bacterium]
MRNTCIFFLFLFTFICCKKATEPEAPQSIKVVVIPGSANATIFWESIKGYSDSVLEYKVYIHDSLISNHMKTRQIIIKNLSENTSYNAKIEAFADNKKIAEQLFQFATLKNQAPLEFAVSEIAIQKNSVLLSWSESTDPENSKVVYDIYFNNQLKISNIVELNGRVGGLDPGTLYSVEIKARDLAGNTRETAFTFKTILIDKSVLVHRFIQYQGYKRDFAYYLPSYFDSSGRMPLVFALHGANGNAWNEIRSTYFKTIADREGFILLMPQALTGTFNGETYFQWNAHYIFPWDDVSLLNYLIDYMYTKYNIDLSKVYISGMSNGGYMTFFAARGLQDRVAAIAPISGLISANVFTNYSLNRPVPLCYMHGTADNIVKIDGYPSADSVISFWITNNKCSRTPLVTQLPDIANYDNSTVTLYQYKGQTADSEIEFYKIVGGGHSVPGIETGANMDINACEVIWSFFSRHSYPGHSEGKIVDLQ